MLNKSNDTPIYLPAVLDFVTIAVEISSFLESDESISRDEWIDRILKMLPLLYVKASLLPETFRWTMNRPLPSCGRKITCVYRLALRISWVKKIFIWMCL